MPHTAEPRPAAGPGPRLVDATAGRAAALLFGVASFVRRRRSLHPDGVACEAELTVDGALELGTDLFDRAGRHRCVVRLSRAIGLPERTPEIFGLAVRVFDDDGAVRQDLLFSTVAGNSRIARQVLAPAGSLTGRPLSTILPYRTDRRSTTLLAVADQPVRERRLDSAADAFMANAFEFVIKATIAGTLTDVARLRGGAKLSPEQAEALRFNPYHAESDLAPAGLVNALRRRSYRASQQTRSS